MRLKIYINDEGITDDTFKDGDIFSIHDDTWEPGEKDKKRFLCVQIDGSTGGSENELLSSEFTVGPDNTPIIRRLRKYRLHYAPKLTPEELEAVRDREATVELMTGVFSQSDLVRKQ